MKEIRFNADVHNSKRLRAIQDEYKKLFAPATISLEALANLAITHGTDNVRKKLNIAK